MPIVGDALNCVVYLYRTAIDAKKGVRAGGSGFLVAIRSKTFPNSGWIYAVTNAHVVNDGFQVIRLTTRDGKTEVVNRLKRDKWIVSETDDLAIFKIEGARRYNLVMESDFLSNSIEFTRHIGVGDDVMMMGRFIGHDGIQTNRPVARTGIISMMPAVELDKEDGGKQLSYLVECKSISGFSGSPVFVYRPWHEPSAVSLTPEVLPQDNPHQFRSWLLGIDWCHLPIEEEVFEFIENKLVKTEYRVKTNSGFAGVIPVSRLRDMLDAQDLKKTREDEAMDRERNTVKPNTPVKDVASEPTQDTLASNPKDRIKIPIPKRGQFERDLKKATRRRKD